MKYLNETLQISTFLTFFTMKNRRTDTYFRNAHLFIKRAKDVIIIKNAELIRENL